MSFPRNKDGGGTHSPSGEGGRPGVTILEDSRHSSVLYLYRILFEYLYSSPCLISLQLDDRDFEELRSQLGGRVCRYLTCDRQEEARRGLSTAAGLLVVLLAAAVIYLTFSYYVVWIVF